MKPLYNKYANLVGWLSDDQKSIFDLNLDWVGFVELNKSIWSVSNRSWLGHLRGNNILDTEGLTVFWNPETPIINTIIPPIPNEPLEPIKPEQPLKPMKRSKIFYRPELLVEWSHHTWESYFKY